MSKRNLAWMGIIVLMMALFYLVTPRVARQDSVYLTYAPLVEVDAMIRHHFVEPVPQGNLVDGAIRGMMFQLDPYSRYIAPEEMDAFERYLNSQYIGIGVEMGTRHGQITVIAPVEESPAARAGILAGDVILSVDGRSTEWMSVLDVDARLVGTPGSVVSLAVRHADGQEETLEVVRGPVVIHAVKGICRTAEGGYDYLIDPARGIGYIRISNFRENTAVELDRALSALTGQGARAIVLDLRFNGGGLLLQAVEVVDRFVADGVIVSVVEQSSTVQRYRAKAEGTLSPLALAVLVNGSTASAAEIVAGALQDFRRAVIVGTRTFGKGSVQRVRYLKERNAAIRLTEAHYVLPSGRLIHRTPRNAETDAWGVVPDVVVPITEEQSREVQTRRRVVDSVSGRAAATQESEGPETAPAEADSRRIWVDPQLAAALQLVASRVGGQAETTQPGPESQP
jgi:carboxyl-terminal processing protease